MTRLPDYKDDPEAYEIEERSRPDEMLMLDRAGEYASSWLDDHPRAHTLDLCCGTGLSMRSLVTHPHTASVTGVDISVPYLDYARRTYASAEIQPRFIIGDAVEAPTPLRQYDLLMLASAYHHIEDDRKLRFLHRVRSLIGRSGRAVMAENILPRYIRGDPSSYANSVRCFYVEVLKTARAFNPKLSDHVAGLIERVAEYGYAGEYEYKVSMDILRAHLASAGLEVVRCERVWPLDNLVLEPDAGNFVFLLKTQEENLE